MHSIPRRSLLKKAAATGAVAWTARSPASAMGSCGGYAPCPGGQDSQVPTNEQDMLNGEIGLFTVTINVWNGYQPGRWSTAWLVDAIA